MTNLTEQWHKGELIDGKIYYITFLDSEPFEATFRATEAIIPFWKFEAHGRQYCDENGRDCVKVLAEVPSYEQWQKHRKTLLKTQEKNCDLEIKNAQLKELLKECREHLITYKRDDLDKGYVVYDGSYLIDKISEVLGEE